MDNLQLAPAQILVVEDEAIIALELRNRLENFGYNVFEPVDTGEEAVQTAAKELPDLVLMDIRLNGRMGGIEAAARIRSLNVPVIYLTSYADEETLQRAKKSEPFGYLLKPFGDRELRSAIEMALYKHQMDRRLRESQEKYRLLAEHSSDAITLIEDGTITYVSPALSNISGYTVREWIGRTVPQLAAYIHPDDRERILNAHQQADHARQITQKLSYRLKHKQGHYIWVEDVLKRDYYDEANGHNRIIINTRDITDRRRAEEQLRFQAQLLDSVREAVVATDMTGHIIFWGQGAAALYGYQAREVMGSQSAKVLETQGISLKDRIRHVHERGYWAGQCVKVRKDGTTFWADTFISLAVDEHGQSFGFIGIDRDITAHKLAEEAVRQRTTQLEALREVALELAAQLDLDQLLQSIVSRAIKLIDSDECGLVLYRPVTRELELVTTAGDALLPVGTIFKLEQGFVGKIWAAQQPLVINNYRHWNPYATPDEEQPAVAVIGTPINWGQKFLGVLVIKATAPRSYTQAEAELLSLLAIQAAIAIRNARLYAQTQQDAKTKATLLQEVNHRVKNNLSGIIGMLYVMRRHAQQAGTRPGDQISTINDLIHRIEGLLTVHHLLSASAWSDISLAKLATQVVQAVFHWLPPDKEVKLDIPTVDVVQVSPEQASSLALIINELATNTIKYALTGRQEATVTVRIAHENSTVTFEFSDDGPGYPDQVLSQQQYNVGIGLIKAIVNSNLKGKLSLSNNPGALTVVNFPVAGTAGQPGLAQPSTPPPDVEPEP